MQAVAPAALLPSKRTAFRANAGDRGQGQGQKGAVEMIAEALDEGSGNGRAKAVGRTRVRRGQVQARLGLGSAGNAASAAALGLLTEEDNATATATTTGQEGDAEVFDDTDFYQEMLRDVIHAKTGAGAGSASFSSLSF